MTQNNNKASQFSSLSELTERLRNIQTEYEVRKRQQDEESRILAQKLQQLRAKDLSRILSIAPELQIILNYNIDQLLSNENGERENINNVYSKLKAYLIQQINNYEENL